MSVSYKPGTWCTAALTSMSTGPTVALDEMSRSWSRAAIWAKDGSAALEFAEIARTGTRLRAEGVAVAAEPLAYRLDYSLETGPRFVTSRLRVTSRGDRWRRMLDLRRDAAGAWTLDTSDEGAVDLPTPGGDPTTLRDA